MESNLDINLDNIFFKSYAIDRTYKCPIYVFDSTFLPSSDQVNDREIYDLLIDETMNKLATQLPETPFSLVVFSSGFSQKKISWIYGVKMYSKISKNTRAKLRQLWVVHESLFVYAVHQVLSNALNINPFKLKQSSADNVMIHHVPNLVELKDLVDISRLRISLGVYLYDYHLTETTDIPYNNQGPKAALANRQYRQLIFDKIFKRLRIEAPKHPLVFQRPGSYQKVNILLGVIARNNYVDLSHWDVYSLGTVFLNFIKGKSKPIFPIDLIPLPISESVEYTYNTFVNMMMYNEYYELTSYIFELFLTLLDNSQITLHDYRSLSKCLTPTLCQEKVSYKSSDRLAIGYRFTNNILLHFRELKQRIEQSGVLKNSVADSQNAKGIPNLAENAPKVPPPRKASPVRAVSSRNTSPARLTQSNEAYLERTRTVSGKEAPPLPKRAEQRFVRDAQSIPILQPDQPDQQDLSPSTSLESLRIECSASPSPEITSKTQSKDSGKRTFKNPSSPRITSGSSIKLDNADNDTESRLVSEDAVKSRSKATSDNFKIDQSKLNLLLENNQKIKKFDEELKKRKTSTAPNSNGVPSKGYSDIAAGNKVSQLAALYEERLIGIKVMEDMRRSQ
ncbi:LAFA_0G03400g1_1 [Lachancea sp. 'fantastica']|nr:LAFA_0G03400g1_1 [Lachancea sp. 'fantastica']